MVVSPQRLTRWPSYVRDRHAAITYTTPRDAPQIPLDGGNRSEHTRAAAQVAATHQETESGERQVSARAQRASPRAGGTAGSDQWQMMFRPSSDGTRRTTGTETLTSPVRSSTRSALT
ncbi:hypothetical protein CKJ76_19520 [Mycobacterium avium]|nr:hypothetical protein CKJ76_19520 [Mycobacterium avium]